MDITTLAAGGEFLGGIAVVISLVYLAGQIRQNSNLLRTSATSITSQLQYGQNEMIARDSEVAQLFYKGASEPDSLTEVERLQFEVMLGLQVQALHRASSSTRRASAPRHPGIGSMAQRAGPRCSPASSRGGRDMRPTTCRPSATSPTV
jgi:hypothetical protein